MNIYLDNAATTKPLESVVEITNKIMKEDYGNPSSLHIMGINAEKIIKMATVPQRRGIITLRRVWFSAPQVLSMVLLSVTMETFAHTKLMVLQQVKTWSSARAYFAVPKIEKASAEKVYAARVITVISW